MLRAFYDAHPLSHLRKGDVLVTSTGLGSIGRVDLLDEDTPCLTDGHVTCLRIRDTRRISSQYLVHYLRSPLGQMQMERFTVGSTGQTELNDDDIKQIKVVYPSRISAQKNVLRIAEKHEKSALRAKKSYSKNLSLSKIGFARLLGL